MTIVIRPEALDSSFLPSLCAADGCLADPAPAQRYCWRHLKSREVQARDIRARQQAAVDRRLRKVERNFRWHLYAIEVEASDLVKFGVSARPTDRLAALQTSNPMPLRMVGHVGCHKELERYVHEFCVEHRVRGEWFRRTGRVAIVERMIVDGDTIGIYDLIGVKPPWSMS